MDVYAFHPLRDSRWEPFVGHHPKASVFHTSGWLRALQRTYGFEPIAFTTSGPAGDLRNAVVFALVDSWLTGRRLVSLPFSDHCEPLVDNSDDLGAICSHVHRYRSQHGLKYVEVRPAGETDLQTRGFHPSETFYLHRLELHQGLDVLLRSFHKDSIQRKIRRAEREGLTCEEGRSGPLIQKLLHLLDLTRRRHGVPMQPRAWFGNLLDCFGENACIRVASREGQPVAGILTLTFRERVVYKYGGSDSNLHATGGMPWLFWQTIRHAKGLGSRELDLGRSDPDNSGLITFKDHWGAHRTTLTYWRDPAPKRVAPGARRVRRFARDVLSRSPLARHFGTVLYRHFG